VVDGVGVTADEATREQPVADDGEPASDDGPGAQARAALAWLDAERLALALLLVPVVVSAVALLVEARPDYFPTSDHALTEMQVRDVGRHPVLVGLYSRDTWNHPGPLFFYLLTPIYRLTGSTAVGIDLGALAINAASIVAMALVARRRGGTPLMLCTLLGALSMARTLGAGYLSDPWNCFVVVFPFALLVLLAWSMACGEAWALWAAVGVATFLAQTHVGFVLLGLVLLAWGVVTLVAPFVRPYVPFPRDADEDPATSQDERRRNLWRATLITVPLTVLLWLPPVLDVLLNAPSNLREVVRWFRAADEGTHSFAEGWRVTTGQFGPKPEWLTGKLPFQFGAGESPFIHSAPLPLLLLPLAATAAVLWRRRSRSSGDADGWRLAVLLGFLLLVSIVAVSRTVGPAFDYRLRWTWVAPMIAFVLVTWTAWRLVAERWPTVERRVLTPLALVALAVLSVVHVATGANGGTAREVDSVVVAALLPDTVEAIGATGPDDGQVLVIDPFHASAYYSRAIVLELERRGFDARVEAVREPLFGRHRVVDPDEPVRARLVVVQNAGVESVAANPDLELIAEWESPAAEAGRRNAQIRDEVLADIEAGRPSGLGDPDDVADLADTEVLGELSRLGEGVPTNRAKADHVAVFLDHSGI
jgi:hypothetical protein